MVENLGILEDNIVINVKNAGQLITALPGSESTACSKSKRVNVGDPDDSSKEGSICQQV